MDLNLLDRRLRRLMAVRRATTFKVVDRTTERDRKDLVGYLWQVRNNETSIFDYPNEEEAQDMADRLNTANVPVFEEELKRFKELMRELLEGDGVSTKEFD